MKLQASIPWLLAGFLAFAAGSVPAAELRRGSAEIEFQGTSTLHDFSGAAKTEPFDVLVEPDNGALIVSGTATVAVARFDTRHARRDENMRKMFDSARFPFATGALVSARIEPARDSSATLALTVRDRTIRVPATIRNGRTEDGAIRFDLDLVLSLREIGLAPPVLLGVIRVGDRVPVRVRVALEKAPEN